MKGEKKRRRFAENTLKMRQHLLTNAEISTILTAVPVQNQYKKQHFFSTKKSVLVAERSVRCEK